MQALVYINHGRVVVDCPAGCGNAYIVTPGETSRICDAPGSGCRADLNLIVPGNMSDLMRELDRRPNPANRNWFPEGHPLAVRGGHPVNQTPGELAAEFAFQHPGGHAPKTWTD